MTDRLSQAAHTLALVRAWDQVAQSSESASALHIAIAEYWLLVSCLTHGYIP